MPNRIDTTLLFLLKDVEEVAVRLGVEDGGPHARDVLLALDDSQPQHLLALAHQLTDAQLGRLLGFLFQPESEDRKYG